MQYIPMIISAVSCLIAVLSFNRTGKKDDIEEIENRVKVNQKLDWLCNVSEDIKSAVKDINALSIRVSILENKIETIKEHGT